MGGLQAPGHSTSAHSPPPSEFCPSTGTGNEARGYNRGQAGADHIPTTPAGTVIALGSPGAYPDSFLQPFPPAPGTWPALPCLSSFSVRHLPLGPLAMAPPSFPFTASNHLFCLKFYFRLLLFLMVCSKQLGSGMWGVVGI